MCRISGVIKAARKLDVDQDEIDDMQIWKGDEELGEVKLNERGDWVAKFPAPGDEMEGVEEQLTPLSVTLDSIILFVRPFDLLEQTFDLVILSSDALSHNMPLLCTAHISSSLPSSHIFRKP
jgi:hypothetical protein